MRLDADVRLTKMNSLHAFFVLIGQVDQGWRDPFPSERGNGSPFGGLIIIAVIGFVVAWIRSKSESFALWLLVGGVLYGSIMAARQEDKILMFPVGLVALGFLASIFWKISGLFSGKN